MPLAYDQTSHTVVLKVGQRPDRVWHFWSPLASSRAASRRARRLHGQSPHRQGARLQMGMDYWRLPTIPYGLGGNNHEAGARNWYFPSAQWQEAVFTDIGGPKF
jgi:hypothetical protein